MSRTGGRSCVPSSRGTELSMMWDGHWRRVPDVAYILHHRTDLGICGVPGTDSLSTSRKPPVLS